MSDPRITVSGEHHRGMGVTVVLSASHANSLVLRKAEELIRYSTTYAPYMHMAADGSVIIGTSEVSKQEGGYSHTQHSDLYVTRAQQKQADWICMVLHSGFHNGSQCTPADPHGGDWECGWYFHTLVKAPGPGAFTTLPGVHDDHA